MKQRILATTAWILILGASSLFAQPPGTPPHPPIPDNRLEALHLSDTQKAQFRQLREKYRQQFETMRQGQAQHREELGQAMQTMRSELRSLLTPEQQKQFDAMERPARMQRPALRGLPNHPTAPPIAHRRGNGPTPRMMPPSPGATEMRTAMQAYSDQTILPVLKRERKALEANISPADRQLLASLRTQAKAHGLVPGIAPRPGKPGHPGARKNHPAPPSADLEKLEKRYAKDIEKIFARLEPQVDRWNAEMQAIQEKGTPAAKGAHPSPKPPRPAAYHWLNPTQFLLLSPE